MENLNVRIADIPGRLAMVNQGPQSILNAKTLTFIGQKKIEAMLVEAEEVMAVLEDPRKKERYEDASRT